MDILKYISFSFLENICQKSRSAYRGKTQKFKDWGKICRQGYGAKMKRGDLSHHAAHMLLFLHPDDMLHKALDLGLMGDDDHLPHVELLEHVPYLVQLLRGKAVRRLVQDDDILGLDAHHEIIDHLVQAEPVRQCNSALLPAGELLDEGLRSEEHTSELQSQFHLVC